MFDTTFQWVGVPLAVALAALAVTRFIRRPASRRVAGFWALTWLAAAAAIAAPNLTTTLARSVGISRGADLLLYCAVLGGFLGFWSVSVQLRRTQREITSLARTVALQGAHRAEQKQEHTS